MRLTLIPAIHRATHRIALYLTLLPEHGIAQGEAHILALLAQSGPATVGALHDALAHKRSTLTSILDRLVERGLVTRETGTDRRTFVVALTRKGKRVAMETLQHLLDLEAAIKRKFGVPALDSFLSVVAAIEEAANTRMPAPK